MSDIMVPGVSDSGIDTDGMVDDIMEAERAPVTRMEERIDTYEEEREAWQELGRRVSNLQEASRLLFGFENPFNDRMASSTDESVVTATAERGADEGVTSVSVKQLAEADRFVSRNLTSELEVPAGRYGFRVGESEEYFRFSGGSLESFAQAINQRAGDVVGARVVRNSASTKVIMIEAKQTGAENQLSFLEDARAFALEASILEEVRDEVVQASIEPGTVAGTTPAETRSVDDGTLTVAPEGRATLKMPSAIDAGDELVMELDVAVTNLSEEWTEPDPPPGPQVPDPGDISLGDVTVENAPSSVPLPDWQPPEPPVVRDDLQLLYLRDSGERVPLPELDDTDGFETIRIPLAEFADTVDALEVRNNNTHREVSIRNVVVFDPRRRGDVAPVNPLSTARDAIAEIEGIEVVRPSNSIDDLVENVTLDLRGLSRRPVEVTVEPDREAVTDTLIEFIFYYNELIREINILTRAEQSIVDELTNLSQEEREAALEKLGLLQGNMALNSLKSRLQRIMMDAYPTEAGDQLTMLAQLGISSNESGPGGDLDASRLRGYMEMNPADVSAALQSYFRASRQLFGNDTDGDRAVDTGVAYELDRNLRPYVETGGLIATRTGGIDQSISTTRDRIERERQRLDGVRERYEAEFAQMEAAMRRMQEQQQALDKLPSPGGSGN
ncbi:MAG: flagellar filament capping protein FliD [Spirochaetota bacterium]